MIQRTAVPGGRRFRLFSLPGLWALADQGVISLGNFLTGLLLARELSTTEFGKYVVLLGIILFLNSVQNSLVSYPLSLRGSVSTESELKYLTGASICLTICFAIPMIVALYVASWFLDDPFLLLSMGAALLCWQVQLSTRTAFVSQLRHREALWGDAISYGGQALLIWTVVHSNVISLYTVFGIMACTSAAASVLQYRQLNLTWHHLVVTLPLGISFIHSGIWMLLTSIVTLPTLQAFPWVLALSHGTVGAASYQAIVNIVGITNPIMFGISSIVVPSVARSRLVGRRAALGVAARYATLGFVLLTPYFVLLFVVPNWVLAILYSRESPYAALGDSLRILTVAFSLNYVSQVIGSYLNGIEHSRAAFTTQLASTIAALAVGLPLTALWGVTGACIGLLVVHGVRTVSRLAYVLSANREEGRSMHAGPNDS